jgi:DNA-binding PadR family transcriptional regulator
MSSSNPRHRLAACPCTGGNLDKLVQPAIFMILAREALHGYQIVERLAGTPLFDGSRPDRGGVYRMLRIMEAGGYVLSSWDASDLGPAKRLYRLTSNGKACLERWIVTLGRYSRAINELLVDVRRTFKSRCSRCLLNTPISRSRMKPPRPCQPGPSP